MEIILVSHGKLALGMQDTLKLIVGAVSNLTAYAAYLDGDETRYVHKITKKVEAHVNTQFIILTDILGGSVNTNMTQLLAKHKNVRLIAGMNLPLVLQIVTSTGDLDDQAIDQIIDKSRAALVDVNELMRQKIGEEDL